MIIPDNRWALRDQWMSWNYGSSNGNCWKSEKFALVAKPLGMAWKLSQMVRPALALSPGHWSAPLLVCLDPGWIPPRGMHPSLASKMCPSDSTVGIGLDVSQNDRLGLMGNGSEGFPWIWSYARSGTPNVSAKSVALQSLENAPHMIPPSKSDEEPGKRCALPSSQLGRRGIS